MLETAATMAAREESSGGDVGDDEVEEDGRGMESMVRTGGKPRDEGSDRSLTHTHNASLDLSPVGK